MRSLDVMITTPTIRRLPRAMGEIVCVCVCDCPRLTNAQREILPRSGDTRVVNDSQRSRRGSRRPPITEAEHTRAHEPSPEPSPEHPSLPILREAALYMFNYARAHLGRMLLQPLSESDVEFDDLGDILQTFKDPEVLEDLSKFVTGSLDLDVFNRSRSEGRQGAKDAAELAGAWVRSKRHLGKQDREVLETLVESLQKPDD